MRKIHKRTLVKILWLNCLGLHTHSLEIAIYAGIILFIYLFMFKFLEFFGILVTKVNKNPLWMVQRIFWEKRAKVAIFWGKESLRFPYLDKSFLEVAKTKQDSQKKIYFFVAKFGSFPLVDDYKSTYLTKLGKLKE